MKHYTDSDGRRYVIVERGDALWNISKYYFGTGNNYKQLAAINNISNPNLIYVGQKIYIDKAGSSSGSGSSGSTATTTTTTTNSSVVTIEHFGLQADTDNTLFAIWSWTKSNTDKYQIKWEYRAGGIWFIGNSGSNSVDEHDPSASTQSTYDIPENADGVRFKVKPVSKTYTKNDKETSYWTADWCASQTYNVDQNPPTTPASPPDVVIEKYKLTAELDNLTGTGTSIQFQIVKDNASVFNTGTAEIITGHASYSCTVDAGSEYKVRCRSCKDGVYSDWTEYSDNQSTMPAAPGSITVIRASSATSVYLEWEAVPTATSYDVEYATEKIHFDSSDQTTTQTGIEFNKYDKSGLESGDEYFFRVRAVNDSGESAWTDIRSVVIGKAPAAPTTWSSTTSAVVGEPVTLYWVHNAEDGSSQTYADLELYINGSLIPTEVIENTTDEEEKDKTSSLVLTDDEELADSLEAEGRNVLLVSTGDGMEIKWRVRTAGITKSFGDYSVQRSIDIYAPPTLELSLTNSDSDRLETITSFPFYISGIAGPKTQAPVNYHLIIASNEIYEMVDSVGNTKTVNKGEEIYSKHFDTSDALLVEFSAGNIDLENTVSYTATCTVTMDSGLTTKSSLDFTVSWSDELYEPNAEIGVDSETFVAHIRPYCQKQTITRYKVEAADGVYNITDEALDSVWGEIVEGATVASGEQVYFGMTGDGDEVYYCSIDETSSIEGITLSVYRREFDGSFVELATGLSNDSNTYITDPHPSLDYARYRIVAVTDSTGAVSYYDAPGYPVGGKAVIIQWDEEWSNFDTSNEDVLEQPPWSGSMLKLPYNVDVSDNNSSDVALIEYIGRAHPISYYGTQLGQSATWNVEVEKTDKDTLYALRRLSRWMGDVYVREPSGSGYWANIAVSFSQKHCELTIPVTLNITRVEGGI